MMSVAVVNGLPVWEVMKTGLTSDAGFQAALNDVPTEIVRAIKVLVAEKGPGLDQTNESQLAKTLSVHVGKDYSRTEVTDRQAEG